MTKADLEKLGERLADDYFIDATNKGRMSLSDAHRYGFQAALELLWPVIEITKKQFKEDLLGRGVDSEMSDALAEIEAKLK